MKKLTFIAVLISIFVITACNNKNANNPTNPATDKADLSGAGATFPQPFYNIVFKDYTTKTGNNVTYGGIGSGGGIRSLKDKTVDFGASDAYLSDKELSEIGADVLHIPTCMGAVVLSYNLKDVTGLKLTGDIIADIYLGKITKWNDEKIKSINPGLSLPDKAITPVYRSDGSGTTFVFTDYLTKANTTWATEMGAGKSLKWNVGIAAKGNPGVAGTISQTDGSIGYIGSEYALSLKIPMAILQNSAGNFVEPTTENISAAANVDMPADMRTMVTNSSEPNAYPISCFTWIIVYKEQAYNNRSEAQAKVLADFLNYIISKDGQEVAAKIHYAPLPDKVLDVTRNIMRQLSYNSKPIETKN